MHSPRASSPPARRLQGTLAAALLALLAACSTPPKPGTPSDAPATSAPLDGPPANPPPDLASRPDPEPRVEPLRSGGPNKPYEVLGQRYTPLAADLPLAETGLASWYGRKFHGRPTASGEIYDMYASTAAHRTMPIPSYAQVRNPANGREVVVRVNDRGPFHADRVIDLSYAAALKLGVLRGVTPVEVRRLTHEDIRTGRWRGDGTPADTALALAAPPPAAPLAEPVAAPPAPTVAPSPAGAAAPSVAAPGYWVQLGAFRQRQGAHDLRQQLARELAWLEPWLAIFDDRALYRLQAGPYATQGDAQRTAERIRGAAAVQPMVLQRR
jgi:rare lipoprotein A